MKQEDDFCCLPTVNALLERFGIAGGRAGGPVILLRLTVLLLLGMHLSGCLLNRVYAFKNQFCDYQANFTLLVGDGVTLQMHTPVLLDTDVVWLLGADPTTRREAEGRLELTYVVEKELPVLQSDYSIPLHLRFIERGDEMRLSAGMINRNLSAMITPGLIGETVAHACNSEASVMKKNVEFDLGGLQRSDIPKREQILDALGPPQEVGSNGRNMAYRFRLQGTGPEVERSFARIWFRKDGDEVERIRFRYFIYELNADFVTGRGSIRVFL